MMGKDLGCPRCGSEQIAWEVKWTSSPDTEQAPKSGRVCRYPVKLQRKEIAAERRAPVLRRFTQEIASLGTGGDFEVGERMRNAAPPSGRFEPSHCVFRRTKIYLQRVLERHVPQRT